MNFDYSFEASGALWDNTEPISYASSRRAAAGDLDVIPVAKRRAVTKREKSPSNGVYLGFEVNWWLAGAGLAQGFQPKPGDVVTDGAGVRWTVLTTQRNPTGNWKLGAVDLVLAAGLADSIDLEQSAASHDAAGALVRAWPSDPANRGGTVLYPGLACRVQPQEATVEDERGIRGQQTAYTIFLSQQITIDVRECRAVWKGTPLDLVRYHQAELIDSLPYLEAVRKP